MLTNIADGYAHGMEVYLSRDPQKGDIAVAEAPLRQAVAEGRGSLVPEGPEAHTRKLPCESLQTFTVRL